MISKGFKILVVDSQNNPVADLGSFPYRVFIGNKTGRVDEWDAPSSSPNVFSEYVDEPGFLGCPFTDYTTPAATLSFQTLFPLSLRLPTIQYQGNYLALMGNESGYYAKSSDTISSTGGVNDWRLYDNNGNDFGVNIATVNFGFPLRSNGVQNIIADRVDGSNLIEGASFKRMAAANYSDTRIIADFTATTLPSAFIRWFNALSDYVEPSYDPFAPGGESDVGGGTGNFDGTSVDVDFASLPTLSAVDTGFITLYNPTLTQLQSLANYMWSGLFDIDTFKKLFADPMQAILGLSIVPGPVPSGATQNVRIGNIDSGLTMTKAATQYINVDCGTLNVEEFWGAYLDYEPYTKAEIYLPFIGVHQIAVDDIMNKSVHIMYHIDLLSGGCACEIKCGGSVLYTFIGSCAVSIPVTGSDWTNLINGVLSAASAIGTMVSTGGAAAPAAASTIASAAINSLKPSIEKSGSIAGAGGLLAGKVPVLILTRPRQALPGKQNTFTGYPAFITRSLGALSGYTEVHSIRLSGIDGTESEIDEIEELLKGGVIL